MKNIILSTFVILTIGVTITSCSKKQMTVKQRKKKLEKKKKKDPSDCPKIDC